MKRIAWGAAAALIAASLTVAVFPTDAVSQLTYIAGVRLQSSTPGTADTGNANITGKMIAGQFQGNGVALTDLNASNVTSGTLSDARLTGNVALLNSIQSFTARKNFIATGTNVPFAATSTGAETGVFTRGAFVTVPGLFPTGVYGSNEGTGNRNGIVGVIDHASTIGGCGVGGVALNSGHGVCGETFGTMGYGVYGWSHATAGGLAGVYGLSESGIGVYGESRAVSGQNAGGAFVSVNPDGAGVGGFANSTSGPANGVFGRSSSSAGAGIRGEAAATVGENFGGKFVSLSTNGTGVLGEAWATSGTTWGGEFSSDSPDGYGVKGNANAVTGSNYGVFGTTASGTNGYGVYSAGRFGASGTKSFRIDHPFDPENRYLQHYCAEGPQPLNQYSGNVVTDGKGVAWVELPEYFEEINKDFRYVLTVVEDGGSDEFVQVKVGRKVQGNRFQIRTSAASVEVSWMVIGVRNDLFVQMYGAPVETEKPLHERGKLQHPELYGKPVAAARARTTRLEFNLPPRSAGASFAGVRANGRG